jgi:hypothetical protein
MSRKNTIMQFLLVMVPFFLKRSILFKIFHLDMSTSSRNMISWIADSYNLKLFHWGLKLSSLELSLLRPSFKVLGKHFFCP